MRAAIVWLTVCAILLAVEPRKSAQDYPAHAESAAVDLGAEYQVHSFSAGGQMYFTRDYLVFEAGVYPKKLIELTGSSFELRVNKSKIPLEEASPEFVAAALRHPDAIPRSHLELGGGIGNAGVVIGAPTPTERFPGDPSVRPPLAQAPEDPDEAAAIRRAPQDPAELALSSALRRGEVTHPIAGNVYFYFSGNVRKLKNLSLILHTGSGDLEVPIQLSRPIR